MKSDECDRPEKEGIWQVQVTGDAWALERLSASLCSSDATLIRDQHGDFQFQSDRFEAFDSSNDVESASTDFVAMLNGACTFLGFGTMCLQQAGVSYLRADGRRHVYASATATMRMHATVEVSILRKNELDEYVEVEEEQPYSVQSLIDAALTTPSLGRLLRLQGLSDAGTWTGLYRLYEAAHDLAGGEALVKKNGWATDKDQRRFKHSANSVTVAGDGARHGAESQQPPADPMTIAEARRFIDGVVQNILRAEIGH